MELVFSYDNAIYNINLNKNVIFFGQNNAFKNAFINNFYNIFNGKDNSFLIDGKKTILNEYNFIFINEDNDFANEFKFTKNNVFKKLIYDDIIKKINEDKIINYTNEIFDTIDEKVNKLLDRKINRKSDNNLSFQIEIPDVNSIIDKFTNIYIDDVLLHDNNISKAMKRKLLYQLYLLDMKEDKKNIIVINNFDAFLNTDEIIELLSLINKVSSDNCHFILSSSSNIFEYINLDNFIIYKISNRLISLNILEDAIKSFIVKRNFSNNLKISFEEFYIRNEKLVLHEEILKYKNIVLENYPHLLSKILNSNNIDVVLKKPSIIKKDYIICEDKDLQLLFKEIANFFIDE